MLLCIALLILVRLMAELEELVLFSVGFNMLMWW
jgi:hypothetical protein